MIKILRCNISVVNLETVQRKCMFADQNRKMRKTILRVVSVSTNRNERGIYRRCKRIKNGKGYDEGKAYFFEVNTGKF